jgi:hypothetical protein
LVHRQENKQEHEMAFLVNGAIWVAHQQYLGLFFPLHLGIK